jgi:hypothetical protein
MHYDNATADSGYIDGSGYAIASAEPHFPKLVLKVLDVRLADPFQAYGLDTLGYPQERRLHILWERRDFGIDDGS